MFHRTLLGVLTILSGAVLLATLPGCNCASSSKAPECYKADDCAGNEWPKTLCTEEEGYWACYNKRCEGICHATCQSAADCEGTAWPQYAACEQQDGYWTCDNALCEAHCNEAECADATDCGGKTWPAGAGCEEADGHWECESGSCSAVCPVVECADSGDCAGKAWPAGTACNEADGYWECTSGQCVAACNSACSTDADCAAGDDVWVPPCAGRWTCDSVCDPLCDYSTCGDGNCDASIGENAESCPVDCLDHCQWPSDCVYEKWTQICQGRHTCFMGQCQQTCDSKGCGNGTCDDALGETADSCFKDCLGGPCDTTLDCLGYRWYDKSCPAGGHWNCSQPAGACEAVCDNVTCGDGTCDVMAGEAATGCPSDCQQYDCDLSADCTGLPLPQGCSEWLCVQRNCRPVCT